MIVITENGPETITWPCGENSWRKFCDAFDGLLSAYYPEVYARHDDPKFLDVCAKEAGVTIHDGDYVRPAMMAIYQGLLRRVVRQLTA